MKKKKSPKPNPLYGTAEKSLVDYFVKILALETAMTKKNVKEMLKAKEVSYRHIPLIDLKKE